METLTKTMPNKDQLNELDKAKVRTPSTLFTLQSFAKHINKMDRLKMLTKSELETLKKLHGDVTARWISQGLNFLQGEKA